MMVLGTQPSRFLTLSDFEAFADAAEEFHPHIRFYATFNPKVRRKTSSNTDMESWRAKFGRGSLTAAC